MITQFSCPICQFSIDDSCFLQLVFFLQTATTHKDNFQRVSSQQKIRLINPVALFHNLIRMFQSQHRKLHLLSQCYLQNIINVKQFNLVFWIDHLQCVHQLFLCDSRKQRQLQNLNKIIERLNIFPIGAKQNAILAIIQGNKTSSKQFFALLVKTFSKGKMLRTIPKLQLQIQKTIFQKGPMDLLILFSYFNSKRINQIYCLISTVSNFSTELYSRTIFALQSISLNPDTIQHLLIQNHDFFRQLSAEQNKSIESFQLYVSLMCLVLRLSYKRILQQKDITNDRSFCSIQNTTKLLQPVLLSINKINANGYKQKQTHALIKTLQNIINCFIAYNSTQTFTQLLSYLLQNTLGTAAFQAILSASPLFSFYNYKQQIQNIVQNYSLQHLSFIKNYVNRSKYLDQNIFQLVRQTFQNRLKDLKQKISLLNSSLSKDYELQILFFDEMTLIIRIYLQLSKFKQFNLNMFYVGIRYIEDILVFECLKEIDIDQTIFQCFIAIITNNPPFKSHLCHFIIKLYLIIFQYNDKNEITDKQKTSLLHNSYNRMHFQECFLILIQTTLDEQILLQDNILLYSFQCIFQLNFTSQTIKQRAYQIISTITTKIVNCNQQCLDNTGIKIYGRLFIPNKFFYQFEIFLVSEIFNQSRVDQLQTILVLSSQTQHQRLIQNYFEKINKDVFFALFLLFEQRATFVVSLLCKIERYFLYESTANFLKSNNLQIKKAKIALKVSQLFETFYILYYQQINYGLNQTDKLNQNILKQKLLQFYLLKDSELLYKKAKYKIDKFFHKDVVILMQEMSVQQKNIQFFFQNYPPTLMQRLKFQIQKIQQMN